MQNSGRCVGLTKLQVNEFHRLEFKGAFLIGSAALKAETDRLIREAVPNLWVPTYK